MTNFEKNYGEVINISDGGYKVGIKNGKPVYCEDITTCDSCELYVDGENRNCLTELFRWLAKEYEEPKIQIPDGTPIDAKILTSEDGLKWFNRYYAGFENDKHLVWSMGCDSWSANHDNTGCKTTWKFMKLAEVEE